MRPRNDNRHELLEDIFTPAGENNRVSESEILRLVQAARVKRQRRRHALATAASFAVIFAFGFALWPKQNRTIPPSIAASSPPALATTPSPAPALAAARSASLTPPPVERIDDKTMLAMLGDRPAALVRWPDGRQGLLLLSAKTGRK